MAHQHGQHRSHRHSHQHGAGGLAELLDLDAEVLASYLSEITGWVRQHADETDGIAHRVLDLGAGTGTGTIALAQRFESAEVIAVDANEESLARIRAKATDLGLTDRISTVKTDVDEAWPELEPVDVAWASNSLHEMADPDRVFAQLFTTLNPGGLLAVAEMAGQPLFLPEDIGLGRAGLETRIHEALAKDRSDIRQPRLGPDWDPNLERAGFAIRAKRQFTIELTAPLPAAAGRYAQVFLQRIRGRLDGALSAEDHAVLDTLSGDGPDGVLHRDDLVVRNTRTGWIASKP
jgi:SAM-dependent methyltransferase